MGRSGKVALTSISAFFHPDRLLLKMSQLFPDFTVTRIFATLLATMLVGCQIAPDANRPVQNAIAATDRIKQHANADGDWDAYPDLIGDAQLALQQIPDDRLPQVTASLDEAIKSYQMAMAYRGCDLETNQMTQWTCRNNMLRMVTRKIPAVKDYLDRHRNTEDSSSHFALNRADFIEFLQQHGATKLDEARSARAANES